MLDSGKKHSVCISILAGSKKNLLEPSENLTDSEACDEGKRRLADEITKAKKQLLLTQENLAQQVGKLEKDFAEAKTKSLAESQDCEEAKQRPIDEVRTANKQLH